MKGIPPWTRFCRKEGRSVFTLHRTESPFFVLVVASAGSTPQQVVFTALGRALIEPFVVVPEGQSAGHAMCISHQSVDICK